MLRNNPRSTYNELFFDELEESSLQSAKVVVPLILDLIKPNSVADVGCGVGTWLSVFKEHGIHDVLGIDGGYVDNSRLFIRENEFLCMDLSHPSELKRTFDLALCLEVAEHLPKESAKRFVSWLTGLAPFVIFSAALPGQVGKQHINLQWPSYWEKLFLESGFLMLDPIRPLIWQSEHVAWWYRQNIYLFVQSSFVTSNVGLSRMAESKRNNHLTLIHTGLLTRNLSLLSTLKRLPSLIIYFFKNGKRRDDI